MTDGLPLQEALGAFPAEVRGSVRLVADLDRDGQLDVVTDRAAYLYREGRFIRTGGDLLAQLNTLVAGDPTRAGTRPQFLRPKLGQAPWALIAYGRGGPARYLLRALVTPSTTTLLPFPLAQVLPPHDGVARMRLGDLDGDSNEELVVARREVGALSYRIAAWNPLGSTAGKLLNEERILDTSEFRDIFDLQLADLDGDGFPEIVIFARRLQLNSARHYVLRNRGDGTFTPAERISPVSGFAQPFAVRRRQDGRDEVLLSLRTSDTLELQSFGASSALAPIALLRSESLRIPEFRAFGVLAGSATQEGRLVISAGTVTRVYGFPQDRDLYTANGALSFEEATDPGRTERSLLERIVDLDGDGAEDLLVAGAVTLRPAFARAAGFVSDSPLARLTTRIVATGDWDGDGDLDLITARPDANGDYILGLERNDGAGGYQPESLSGEIIARSLDRWSMQDLDADGDGDLVRILPSEAFGRAEVRRQDGATLVKLDGGASQALPIGPLQSLDLDGDGQPELVALAAFPNPSTGSLPLRPATPAVLRYAADATPLGAQALSSERVSVRSFAFGDFDGDGRPDLLSASSAGEGRFHRNLGGLSFQPLPMRLQGGGRRVASATGDFDGDGRDDVLAGDRIWLATNSFSFRPGPILVRSTPELAVPLQARSLDLDGDSDLDLLDETGTIWLNDGRARFFGPYPLLSDDGPEGAARDTRLETLTDPFLGDVDGNGSFDLVTSHGIALSAQARLRSSGMPKVGTSFRALVEAFSGEALVFASPATGLLQVPGLGAVGLDLAQAQLLSALPLDTRSGTAELRVEVPNAPSLIGLPLHLQALLLDFAGEARLSNRLDLVLRRD